MKLYQMPPSAGPSPGQPDYGDPEDAAWERARGLAESSMKCPEVVAECFDAGAVLMPEPLAQLVALASECPKSAYGVVGKLHERIGELFVEWVDDVMVKSAFEDMKP